MSEPSGYGQRKVVSMGRFMSFQMTIKLFDIGGGGIKLPKKHLCQILSRATGRKVTPDQRNKVDKEGNHRQGQRIL